jgi:hypothetical protein
MNVSSRSCLLGSALVAGAGALPLVAGAQSQAIAKAYVVTLVAESAAGATLAHEGLAIQRAGNAARMQLASADGSVLSQPVTFTSQGEIASNSQDGAVTCYNMAMNALARQNEPINVPDAAPAAVFVRFGASVVRIPLTPQAIQTQGRSSEIALGGRSSGTFSIGDTSVDAGIIINATVAADAGELRGATFEEIHYLGTPTHVITRSTCVLQRMQGERATARV